MARVSRAQAERHREDIAEVAARLFRERGISGVSIAELTGACGLTHGGFYGHFESKDHLAAEAVARAFSHSKAKWHEARQTAQGPTEALATIIARYLRTGHRDDPGPGCAASALVGDIAREAEGKPVRAVYAAGIDGLIEEMAELIAEETGITPDDARIRAIAQFASLTGAIALARATKGTGLSDEILTAVRKTFGVGDIEE
ncbi:MAG TPA: TetR family transcriptional regulator [Stellaceae bacterium]|nr:TetR family transcriptional regulator [Stellaceae bacterium]